HCTTASTLIPYTTLFRSDLSIKMQLQETAEMLNLSFIAKHYFHKTRGWLSQRINSHVVNGKPAKFTEKEMDTLNFALKDMGKKRSEEHTSELQSRFDLVC